MADNTKIEWADATVNYVNGCSVISAGCTNCYAMRLAGTRMKHDPSRAGLTRDTKAGPVWTGEVRANEKMLLQPLAWKRPRRIFWNAHGDLFHENVPDAWIDRQFAVMALTPQHTHMVLTKRPERMRAYLGRWQTPFIIARAVIDMAVAIPVLLKVDPWPVRTLGELDNPDDITLAAWPLPNVWLGTSVEDQRAADERIPHLLATPAAVRFLSCEPLLGPVNLNAVKVVDFKDKGGIRHLGWENVLDHLRDPDSHDGIESCAPSLNWIIAGGESGPGARPMHPDWARSLRNQCAAAGVAFHFKQWGEWAIGPFEDDDPACLKLRSGNLAYVFDDGLVMGKVGKARAGRLLDGRTHDDFPGSLSHG